MTARTTALGLVLFAVGCGGFSGEEDQPPGTPPADENPPPPPPVKGALPPEELNEQLGVFVALPGAPDADGTRAKPFGSITPAIERARATSKRVYVCAGTFKEAVTMAAGIPIIGGLDCSRPEWKIGTMRTRVESPTSPALRAENIAVPTRVEGFDFVAPDGTVDNVTSIGFIAKNAGSVEITKTSIAAGKGHDGAPGVEGTQLTLSETKRATSGSGEWKTGDLIFGNGHEIVGGTGGIATCVGAAGIAGGNGGAGGVGGNYYGQRCDFGGDPLGLCFRPAALVWHVNPGGVPGNGSAGAGSNAQSGVDGKSATAPGLITANGFVPADGTAGTSGSPGKGGAGGNGGVLVRYPNQAYDVGHGPSGAGGGAGGCPGLAGTPAKGGGASIGALLSQSAGLAFNEATVTARAAGAGGRGTFGSAATTGGRAGDLNPNATAASPGETGGRSGISGSGAGGSSIGIAYSGGEPIRTSTVVEFGALGAGVAAETKTDGVGVQKELPASAAGVAQALLGF